MARTDQPHKTTFDAFVAKVSDLTQPVNAKHATLDYSRPETRAAWNGSKSKIPIWCGVHAEFFVQQAANHTNGQGCPKCGKEVYKAKRRTDDPIAKFRAVHGDAYDYSRVDYVNVAAKIEIVCGAHGPFWQKPNAHISGHGCPECWRNRRTAFARQRTQDYREAFAARAAAVHKGAYALLTLPEDSHDDVRLNCPKHGDFTVKAYSHLDGHGCPVCGRTVSYTQRAVAQFIRDLGVEVIEEDRKVLGGLEIDIWVPSRRIGVEYHGNYWHTEARVGNLHTRKYEAAKDAGARLIQVFDFEWLERREAVENRLEALFAVGPAVGARTCDLRPVPWVEASRFFRRVHTQGAGSVAAASYGLYRGDQLMACMSFGKSRYGSEGWELLRYASEGRVQGGFSRLLARFRQEHEPTLITSYCDRRWGDGDVYRRNGFALEAVTQDYWYADKRGQRISRFAAQQRPAGVSEREHAQTQGWERVLGAGNQRWTLRP